MSFTSPGKILDVNPWFRLETCMNSLVKVPPYSKLNFQGKIVFTQNWCNITLREKKILNIYRSQHVRDYIFCYLMEGDRERILFSLYDSNFFCSILTKGVMEKGEGYWGIRILFGARRQSNYFTNKLSASIHPPQVRKWLVPTSYSISFMLGNKSSPCGHPIWPFSFVLNVYNAQS